MNKTVLTDEESRKLIELGVNAGEGTFFPHPEGEYWQGEECGDICFTLEDLLAMLPKKITDRRNIYELRIGVTDCLFVDEQWYVEYKDSRTDIDELDTFRSADELIDAVYAEICFLKTNNIKEL